MVFTVVIQRDNQRQWVTAGQDQLERKKLR